MRQDNGVGDAYPGYLAYRWSWSGFVAVGVFSFFVNFGVLASPLYMQQVFDRVLTSRNLDTLLYLTIFVIGFLAVMGVLDAVRGVALSRIARWWDATVRSDLTLAVIETSRVAGAPRTAALLDLATVRNFVGGPSLQPFFDAPWTPAFIFVIALIHPMLGVIALSAALMLLSFAFLNDRMVRRRSAGASGAQAEAQSAMEAAARQADSVVALNMASGLLRRIDRLHEQAALATCAAASGSAMWAALSRFTRYSAQILILGVGAYYATLGEMSAGGMIAASVILGRALAPVDQALSAWRAFVGARDAHGRIQNLFIEAPQSRAKTKQPTPRGVLSLKEATFAHAPTASPILNRVSLELTPSEITAIVGPSGAGKSTLCRLMVGGLEASVGDVRLDGAALQNWPREQLAGAVGYAPQSAQLIDGTVRDNITRFQDGSDEEVTTAAMLAGCHDMINRLPQGYDTIVGSKAAPLSGGQVQRIALARALFGDPTVVVLDEPNSNLDREGDAILLQTLKKLRGAGKTIVLVTHKTAILAAADRVVSMEEGRIVSDQSASAFLRASQKSISDLFQSKKQVAGLKAANRAKVS